MSTSPPLRLDRPFLSLVEPLESRIAPASVGPVVLSIDRSTPATETTGAGSVVFKVTFDRAVTGVTADDFVVFTSVDARANAAVTLAGSGAVYDVTVSGLRGNGDVRLDLVDNDSILGEGQVNLALAEQTPEPGAIFQIPLGGPGVNNGSFTGDAYHLLQVAPKVASITRVTPSPTEATSVSWTVTFTEAVTGVDAADFLTAQTNTLTAPTGLTVTPIAPVSGTATSYTVATTGTLSGLGDITLSLKDNFTIRDSDGNPLQANAPGIDPKSETITSSGRSIATGDLNADGKADVVVLHQTGVNVRLGNGDGTSMDRPISGRFGKFIGVAVADVNGDGKPDLLVAGQTFGSTFGNVSVALGNGDGTFQDQIEYGNPGDSPQDIEVGDLNGDGRPDIVMVANSSGNPVVSVLLGNGNGSFSANINYPAGAGATALALGDLDADGDLDVVTANSSDSVSVLLGTGTGSLGAKNDLTTVPSGGNPRAVALGDFTGDGRPDIVIANSLGSATSSVAVLLSDATTPGSFTGLRTLTTGLIGATDVAVADYNGDGFLDIAAVGSMNLQTALVAAPAEPLVLLNGGLVNISLGGGNGLFLNFGTLPTGAPEGTGRLVAGDFNGDGKADLAAINSSEANLRTLLNVSPGDFTGEAITRAVSAPDLTITSVTDTKNSVIPGESLTYTITYKNLTSKSATGVTLRTQLDPNLEFVASENTGWTQSGSALVKVITGTVPGNSADLTETLKLKVKTVISGGFSSIATTTTISDDGTNGTDPNPDNNRGSDFDALTQLTADVAVTAIDDPDLAIPGSTATYTVHVENTGNAAALGRLTVTLPDSVGFDVMDAANAGWTYDPAANTIQRNPSIPGGAVDQTFSFVVTIFGTKDTDPRSTTASFQVLGSPSDANPQNNSFTEVTPTYSGFLVTAPGVAIGKRFAPPVVRVFDRATGDLVREFLAYEKDARGRDYLDSIRVAVGDFNDDGIDDIVTTTQFNGGRLRVFDGLTGQQFTSGPFATEIDVFPGKRNGAFVAVGDVDGDGTPDIVTGSALGGGKVKVFDGETGAVLKEFTPFGDKFKGGVRVAVGAIGSSQQPVSASSDGVVASGFLRLGAEDIIVGMGFRGAQVKVYDGLSDTVLRDFKVGPAKYRGGVSVATGDVNGDGFNDFIIGRNSGRPSIVEVFSGAPLASGQTLPAQLGTAINPFDLDPARPRNIFGVRVAAVDVDLDGIVEIITSVGVKNGSQVKVHKATTDLGGVVTYNVLADRALTAYQNFPNVALWVAGSREIFRGFPV